MKKMNTSGFYQKRNNSLLITMIISCMMLLSFSFSSYVYAGFAESSGTDGSCVWEVDSEGTLVIRPESGTEGTLSNSTLKDWRGNDDIKKVRFEGTIHAGTSMEMFFFLLTNLEEVDFTGLDTSAVTTMKDMFQHDRNIKKLDLSMLDTSNLKNMSGMFTWCAGLEEVIFKNGDDVFDTSKVENMSSLFYGCDSITTFDFTQIDTSNVTNMAGMFQASGLESIDMSTLNTSKVTNMNSMFASTPLKTFGFSGFDTSAAKDMGYMFSFCRDLEEIDLNGINMSKVTSVSNMFANCSSLTHIDVDKLDTSHATKMNEMFKGCSSLTELDVSSLNTSSATDISGMFSECSSLEYLDVTNFNTSNVNTIYSLFNDCTNLKSVDVSNFDTSKVTSFSGVFNGCESLTDLDVTAWNTAAATSMDSMFCGCKGLTTLDVSNFNTDNCGYFSNMFDGCSGLTSLDISNFDGSKASGVYRMFADCSGLEEIDLSNFKPEDETITSASAMFKGCSSLKELDLSNFDFSNTYNEDNELVRGCSSLERIVLPKKSKSYRVQLVFDGCDSLKEIVVVEPLNSGYMFPQAPANDVYTGLWLEKDSNIAKSSEDWLVPGQYDGELLVPAGRYVWDYLEYNISFNSKGGSEVKSQIVKAGSAVEKPDNPQRDGYTFDGWYLKGKEYDFSEPVYNDITLMGRWTKPAKYTLTYPDGSTVTTDDKAEALSLLDKWVLLDEDLATDENGQIILEDWMRSGQIKIVETEAPEGYVINEKETIALISDEEAKIINNKKPGNPPEAEGEVKDSYDKDKEVLSESEETKVKSAKTGDRGFMVYVVLSLISLFLILFMTVSRMRRKDDSSTRLFSILLISSLMVALPLASALSTHAEDITAETGNFTIQKVDEKENSLEGAKFSIYGKPELSEESVTVTLDKEWDDDDDALGLRPESVDVDLLADGELVTTVTLSEENNWHYKFEGLPKYNDGKRIEYYVREEPLERYIPEIEETEDNCFVITNSDKVKVKISKAAIITNRDKWYSNIHTADQPIFGQVGLINKLELVINDITDENNVSEVDRWDVSGELQPVGERDHRLYVNHEATLAPGKYRMTEEVVLNQVAIPIGDYSLDIGFVTIDFTVTNEGKIVTDNVSQYVRVYYQDRNRAWYVAREQPYDGELVHEQLIIKNPTRSEPLILLTNDLFYGYFGPNWK